MNSVVLLIRYYSRSKNNNVSHSGKNYKLPVLGWRTLFDFCHTSDDNVS